MRENLGATADRLLHAGLDRVATRDVDHGANARVVDRGMTPEESARSAASLARPRSTHRREMVREPRRGLGDVFFMQNVATRVSARGLPGARHDMPPTQGNRDVTLTCLHADDAANMRITRNHSSASSISCRITSRSGGMIRRAACDGFDVLDGLEGEKILVHCDRADPMTLPNG